MPSHNKVRTIKFTALCHVPKWYAQAIAGSVYCGQTIIKVGATIFLAMPTGSSNSSVIWGMRILISFSEPSKSNRGARTEILNRAGPRPAQGQSTCPFKPAPPGERLFAPKSVTLLDQHFCQRSCHGQSRYHEFFQ